MDDVTHPDKTPPSPTSRPVISSHGPMMKDPMVQANDSKIVDPTDPVKTSEANESDETEKPLKFTREKVVEKPEEPEEKPEEPSKTDDNSEAVVDSVVSQAADKKQQEEAEKKAAEEAAHINELVEQKAYYVPINVAKKQRMSRRLTITVASVALIVLAAAIIFVGAA